VGVVIPSVIVGAVGSGGSIRREYIDIGVKQPPFNPISIYSLPVHIQLYSP